MDMNTIYDELIKLAEELRFDEIANNKDFLIIFSRMSNIEFYYAKYGIKIETFSYDILKNLVISLSNCGNKYYRGYDEDRYFVHTFYMIFCLIQNRRLTKNEQKEVINPLLINRQNKMMPFNISIPLEVENIKDLKKWKDEINSRIMIY